MNLIEYKLRDVGVYAENHIYVVEKHNIMGHHFDHFGVYFNAISEVVAVFIKTQHRCAVFDLENKEITPDEAWRGLKELEGLAWSEKPNPKKGPEKM